MSPANKTSGTRGTFGHQWPRGLPKLKSALVWLIATDFSVIAFYNFLGKKGLKVSSRGITENPIILQEEIFPNGLRWAGCTMGAIPAHGREAAQTCREQLPWDGSSARDCGSGQVVVLKPHVLWLST